MIEQVTESNRGDSLIWLTTEKKGILLIIIKVDLFFLLDVVPILKLVRVKAILN